MMIFNGRDQISGYFITFYSSWCQSLSTKKVKYGKGGFVLTGLLSGQIIPTFLYTACVISMKDVMPQDGCTENITFNPCFWIDG